MKESVRSEIENIIKIRKLNCTVDNFINFVIIIDWGRISMSIKLSEDFIREFKHKLNWYELSRNQVLSEDFIREFQDKVNWYGITKKQKLSESFILEFKHIILHNNWINIFAYQKISEDFIIQNQNQQFIRENLHIILKYQKLSKDFLTKFKSKEAFLNFCNYQKLHKKDIEKYDLQISEYNWLYKNYTFKLDKIKNCRLYDIHGEYVIAYKGIRSDNYSCYNFQYQYFEGQTYECHADHNNNEENSFGLSAWTFDKARQYCSEKVIKVKIHINDIAALVHDSNKIRCTRFTVINSVN